MKKLFLIFSSALLLSSLFVFTGCGEDDPTPTEIGPLVTVTSSTTLAADPDENVTITVKVEKGDAAIKSLTIEEDGANIDASRVIDVDNQGVGQVVNLVTGADVDGFTWDIEIKSSDVAGDYTLSFIAEDENGKTDNADVTLTVNTPLTETITGSTIRLYNQAGPAGRGGIDLDSGESTGTKLSSSGNPTVDQSFQQAELRDMGIDSLAGSGDNWRRKIGGINGTSVRYAGNTSTVTDFDFTKITSKEAVEGLYDAATEFSGTLPNWGSFKVSATVETGDIFVVYKSSTDTYYLVLVTNVVETTTLADNEDHYVVSIKY